MDFLDPNAEEEEENATETKQETTPSSGFGFFSSFASSFSAPASAPAPAPAPAKEQETSSFWGFIKEKTVVITDVIRHDVTEFTKTITDETKDVIRGRANPLADESTSSDPSADASNPNAPNESPLKQSSAESGGGISILPAPSLTALSSHVKASIAWLGDILDENSTFTKFPGEQAPEIHILNRVDAQILAIQKDPQTYTSQPTPEAAFNLWIKGFDLNTKTEEIAQLLGSNDDLRTIHHKLVPKSVNYSDFWTRYFFRIHKFHDEEARRQALLKKTVEGENADDDLGWDVGDDDLDEVTTAAENTNQNETITPEIPEIKKDSADETLTASAQGQENKIEKASDTEPTEIHATPKDLHTDESGRSSPSSDVVVVDLQPSGTSHSTKQGTHVETPEQEYELVSSPVKEPEPEPEPEPATKVPEEAAAKSSTEEEGWDDWE